MYIYIYNHLIIYIWLYVCKWKYIVSFINHGLGSRQDPWAPASHHWPCWGAHRSCFQLQLFSHLPEPWLSVHPGNLVNPRMGGIAGSPNISYDRCWSNLLWMISHDLTNFQMNPESSPKQHLALPKHVRSRPLLEVHVWKGGSSPLPDPCFHMHFAGKLTAMCSLTINRITLKVRDFHQNYCPVSKWEAQLSSAENHGSGSSDENGSQSLLVHLLIFLVLTHPHHHLNSHTVTHTHTYIYILYI